MTPALRLRRAGVRPRAGPSRPRRQSSHPCSVGQRDETVDRRFDLGPLEADVAQGAVVELAKACNGRATDEIARDPIPTGAEKPRDRAAPLRDLGPNDRRKGYRHVCPPMIARGNATPSARALVEPARAHRAREAFASPGTIRLIQTKCSDICLGSIETLNSVQ
jgi:hypothetical protein